MPRKANEAREMLEKPTKELEEELASKIAGRTSDASRMERLARFMPPVAHIYHSTGQRWGLTIDVGNLELRPVDCRN